MTQYVLTTSIRRMGVWLRRDAGGWDDICQRLFGKPGYIESRRAAESSGARKPSESQDESHAEWSATSSCFALLLAWMGMNRRNEEERAKAKALLHQWLLTFCSVTSRESALSTVPAEVCSQSCERAGESSNCACWRAVEQMRLDTGPTHTRIERLLGACLGRTECPKCLLYLGFLVLELETSMVQEYDPEAYLTDGTKAVDNQMGRQKRRRIDEGVKESTLQAVAAGRAHNSASLLKAMDDSRHGQAHQWEVMFLKEHLARMQLAWQAGGCFGLAPDAARFGNPGQENVICSVWHADTLTGGWAPPQVYSSRPPPKLQGNPTSAHLYQTCCSHVQCCSRPPLNCCSFTSVLRRFYNSHFFRRKEHFWVPGFYRSKTAAVQRRSAAALREVILTVLLKTFCVSVGIQM